MTSSQELRLKVKDSLPEIVEKLNEYLRGENVSEIKHILEREGRGGKLPHWYELLNTGQSMPNLDGKTKEDAHMQTIGLCPADHQTGSCAVHGHKRVFESKYGTELELLDQARVMING